MARRTSEWERLERKRKRLTQERSTATKDMALLEHQLAGAETGDYRLLNQDFLTERLHGLQIKRQRLTEDIEEVERQVGEIEARHRQRVAPAEEIGRVPTGEELRSRVAAIKAQAGLPEPGRPAASTSGPPARPSRRRESNDG